MTWIINGSPELDAQSNYPTIISTAFATTMLMLVVVTLRGYVRVKIVKRLGPDDWCIFVSAIAALGYITGGVVQTRYGLGLPTAKYLPENREMSLKLNYAFRFLYCIAVSFFKFALCFSFLRITNNSLVMRSSRILIYGTIGFTAIFMVYYCSIVIFACMPIRKFWSRATPGMCLPIQMVYYTPAVITIIIDVILFLVPIPLVLPLRMNRRRKIGLVMTFMLGFITTICSVMRLVGSLWVARAGDAQQLIIWAIAELNTGIITTSLPTLAPLLRLSILRRPNASITHSSGERTVRATITEKFASIFHKHRRPAAGSFPLPGEAACPDIITLGPTPTITTATTPASGSGTDGSRVSDKIWAQHKTTTATTTITSDPDGVENRRYRLSGGDFRGSSHLVLDLDRVGGDPLEDYIMVTREFQVESAPAAERTEQGLGGVVGKRGGGGGGGGGCGSM